MHARGAERRDKKRIAGDLAKKLVSVTIKQKMYEHRKQHWITDRWKNIKGVHLAQTYVFEAFLFCFIFKTREAEQQTYYSLKESLHTTTKKVIVTWRWSISIFSLLPRGAPRRSSLWGRGAGAVFATSYSQKPSRHKCVRKMKHGHVSTCLLLKNICSHLRNRLLTLLGASALRNPCASHVCSWRTPVFHLRNQLLTLPGGPLDALDRYRNPKKKENNLIVFSYILSLFRHILFIIVSL